MWIMVVSWRVGDGSDGERCMNALVAAMPPYGRRRTLLRDSAARHRGERGFRHRARAMRFAHCAMRQANGLGEHLLPEAVPHQPTNPLTTHASKHTDLDVLLRIRLEVREDRVDVLHDVAQVAVEQGIAHQLSRGAVAAL